MIDFSSLPGNTKVWVYQSDRKLTGTEVSWIEEQLSAFTKTWAAHGSQLSAKGTVLNHHHVVLTVTEDQANASGCSIDSSVRFIKQIGAELNINFFDRLKILIQENGNFSYVPFGSITNHKGAHFYDLTVTNIEQFNARFKSLIA